MSKSIGIPVSEVRKQLETEWEDGVQRAINRGLNRFDGPFYIQVPNIKRTRNKIKGIAPIFFERESCPTPTFDTVVYRYDPKDKEVEFLWCLPNKEESLNYYHNKDKILPSEYCLLEQVLKYFDGTLFQLVDRMEHNDGRFVQ